MKPIAVLDVFRGPVIGETAILDFPTGLNRKLNMILKREDDSTWEIIGLDWPRLSSLTNSYKDIQPERFLYGCELKELRIKSKLQKGDKLYPVI